MQSPIRHSRKAPPASPQPCYSRDLASSRDLKVTPSTDVGLLKEVTPVVVIGGKRWHARLSLLQSTSVLVTPIACPRLCLMKLGFYAITKMFDRSRAHETMTGGRLLEYVQKKMTRTLATWDPRSIYPIGAADAYVGEVDRLSSFVSCCIWTGCPITSSTRECARVLAT